MHPENIRKGRRRKRTRNNPLACRFPAYRPDKGKSRAGPVFCATGKRRSPWRVERPRHGIGERSRPALDAWPVEQPSSLPVSEAGAQPSSGTQRREETRKQTGRDGWKGRRGNGALRGAWSVHGMASGSGAARRWMRGRWRNRALTGFSFSALLVRGA